MATEVQANKSAGLGWENYPKPMSDEEREAIVVRKALTHEIPDVVALRSQIFFPNRQSRRVYPDEKRIDRSPRTIHGVALDDQKPVAVGLVYPTGAEQDQSVFTIESVGVLPQYRDKGIGTDILEFLEERALLLGATSIQLQSLKTCVSFYENSGYTKREATQNGDILQIPMGKVLEPAGAAHA